MTRGSPYHPRVTRLTDLTDTHVAETERQLKPNTCPRHLAVKAEKQQLRDTHMTYARLDSRPHEPGHAPAIHRLILSVLLYFPGPTIGHMYIPELLCLYLYGEVVWAAVRLELSFCPGHVVVGQPRCVLMVRSRAPNQKLPEA